MKIPKGFIKDSEGIYRRGNFIFKDNKIFRESSTIEKLKENYPTMQDCIREVLSFYSILGDKPRTTNVYIDKAGKGFKSSEKFSKNTVAVVTPDRNVFEVNTTDIGDSTDFKDLVNKDKKDLPKNVKSLKTFSSDKPKDFDKLKESDEGFVKKLYATKTPYEVLQLIINDLPDGDLKDEAISSWTYYKDRNRSIDTYHDLIADLLDTMEENPNWRQDRIKKTIPKEDLNESAEDGEKFWSQGFKIGDTIDSSGAGKVEILDLNKDADYILVKRQTGFQPFVACWAPSINEEGKLYWGQGHYFSTEEDAKEYFNSKLNESEKLNTNSNSLYIDLDEIVFIANRYLTDYFGNQFGTRNQIYKNPNGDYMLNLDNDNIDKYIKLHNMFDTNQEYFKLINKEKEKEKGKE